MTTVYETRAFAVRERGYDVGEVNVYLYGLEARIAELFYEKMEDARQVITQKEVEEVIHSIKVQFAPVDKNVCLFYEVGIGPFCATYLA